MDSSKKGLIHHRDGTWMGMTLLILTALSFLCIALPFEAIAQVADDPDVFLFEYGSVRDTGGLHVDIAYANDGTLVAAYVERDHQNSQPDKLVVKASGNGGQNWQTLWRGQPAPWLNEIRSLSIDVASGFAGQADKHVVIGAHVIDDNRKSAIAYFDGRYDTIWKTSPHRSSCEIKTGYYTRVRTSTTVIPLVGQAPDQYIVGIAYSVTPAGKGSSMVYIDYVGGSGSTAGGLFKRSLVAGPGGEVIDGTADYTNPSLVHDDSHGFLSIAFADQDLQIVHVGSGYTRQGIPVLKHKWATQPNDGRPEFGPALAVDPVGDLILATRSGYLDFWGASPLIVYQGTLGGSLFIEFSEPLHDQAQSIPDVEVREGLMVVTARAVVDPGAGSWSGGILAFSGSPDYREHLHGLQIQQTILNDKPIGLSNPRVAITPDGARPSAEAVAYCQDEFHLGMSVLIDP